MRKILPFNQGWQFRKDGETSWQTVDLPHTWNALDGQDGGDNYYQGIGWYQKPLLRPTLPRYLSVSALPAKWHRCSVTGSLWANIAAVSPPSPWI